MPGSAAICGLMPCSNSRYVYDNKTWTITLNCQLFMGVDMYGELNTVDGIVQHFMNNSENAPTDGSLYYLAGKMASVNMTLPVDTRFNTSSYNFIIEADEVCRRLFYRCYISFQQQVLQLQSMPDRCEFEPVLLIVVLAVEYHEPVFDINCIPNVVYENLIK
jgi:hypothetical protein